MNLGQNWHQVVDAQVTPLGKDLDLPDCTGFAKLLIGAGQENTTWTAIGFDDCVRRTFAGTLTLNPVAPLEAPKPFALGPGQTIGFDLEADFDPARFAYGAARFGVQDLYVMCYR